MENENIMNEELDVTTDMEIDEYTETSGDGLIGKVVVGTVFAAAAGFAAWKFRDKVDAWKIKRLEKKGYVVTKVSDEQIHEGEYRDCSEDEDEEG